MATTPVRSGNLHGSRLGRWYASQLVKRPELTLTAFCFVLLAIAAGVLAAGMLSFTQQTEDDWTWCVTPATTIRGSVCSGVHVLCPCRTHDSASVHADMLRNAQDARDSQGNAHALPANATAWRSSASHSSGQLLLMYRTAQHDNVFTVAHLQTMCLTENAVLDHEEYPTLCALNATTSKCRPVATSVLAWFFAQRLSTEHGYVGWDCVTALPQVCKCGTHICSATQAAPRAGLLTRRLIHRPPGTALRAWRTCTGKRGCDCAKSAVRPALAWRRLCGCSGRHVPVGRRSNGRVLGRHAVGVGAGHPDRGPVGERGGPEGVLHILQLGATHVVRHVCHGCVGVRGRDCEHGCV